MSKSYTPIMFFSDEIEINAHTARFPEHLRHISIREFADGQPVKLSQCNETGDYLVERGRYPNIVFIEGQEI